MSARLIVLCILCLTLPMPYQCDTVQTPILGIELSETGFHRDLTYTVQFDYPLAGKDCEYILEQTLPAAVYVSVDQLNDLKRLKKLNAIYPAFVDVEAPTEKSVPFTMLVKGAPKITDSLRLPIHFRYHAPRESSTFVIVNINAPTMYIACPRKDNDLIDNELKTSINVTYCLDDESATTLSMFTADKETNGGSKPEFCNWKLISYKLQSKSPLRAKIPVGNEKGFTPVLYCTIVASWFVSLWTVFRTHNVPRRINQKLEEQRILKNKIK